MKIRTLMAFVLAAAVGSTALAGGGSSGGKGGGGGKGGSSGSGKGGSSGGGSRPAPLPPQPGLEQDIVKAITDIMAKRNGIDCKTSIQYWGSGFIECIKPGYVAARRVDERIQRTTDAVIHALRRSDHDAARELLLTLSAFPEGSQKYRHGELAYELKPLQAAVAKAIELLERSGTR